MKEVTLEIATVLKDKGFCEKCAKYYLDGTLLNFKNTILDSTGSIIEEINIFSTSNHNPLNQTVDAPYIEQVLEWLRKDKGIYVHAYYLFFIEEKTSKKIEYFFPVIQRIGIQEKSDFGDGSHTFITWEDAIMEGIRYTVINLI